MNDSASTKPAQRWGPRIVLVLLVAVVLPLGVSILYSYAPTEYPYMPCILHSLTGLHCPGCGGTRCAHALLHGDFQQAFAYNPLVILLSPWLAYGFCGFGYTLWTGKKLRQPRLPHWGVWILVGAIFFFGIARNIPVYPLCLLAPHQL